MHCIFISALLAFFFFFSFFQLILSLSLSLSFTTCFLLSVWLVIFLIFVSLDEPLYPHFGSAQQQHTGTQPNFRLIPLAKEDCNRSRGPLTCTRYLSVSIIDFIFAWYGDIIVWSNRV
ncbi:hypothetical protein COCSADRAFT_259442 [Bipolaris sorokiniana ND90Pr]|uniref:Uncharacterized protein n=1 Tax=Cochliobolus sativus (strain ND90Pr / ATCC 201652) TaxID=665912 RepID=M2SPT4_COCSN|nr:uncharacterized protein COCSADRAFT_259442 [Bipolaris sorokiniana ND90Pr]EMD58772.1 hypothetical protein COCSADRAFT_259442 [Bipolaris sorokiniana ND90Pr]